jgi:hypothetical protein
VILIAGGYQDPNIACLVQAASQMKLPFYTAFAGMADLDWDISNPSEPIQINKIPATHIKSVFQRFNSFGYDTSNAQHYAYYHSFYHTLRAYALNANLKMFDGAIAMAGYCKPLDLITATKHGLKIPATLVTDNTIPTYKSIFKRVLGGAHTEMLNHKKQFSFGVGFAQEFLPGNEIRIYVVGQETFCFHMKSSSLDYREKQDVEVVYIPESEVATSSELSDASGKIKAMSHEKGLYFSASDLKRNEAGDLCFLEMNTSPMFVRFDQASQGELCATMVNWLAGEPRF